MHVMLKPSGWWVGQGFMRVRRRRSCRGGLDVAFVPGALAAANDAKLQSLAVGNFPPLARNSRH